HLHSLDDLFQCYPQPSLIRDLWTLAEDARIEACLKAEYPGLRRDMDDLLREELSRRSLTYGMSVKEMIVDLLLQLSVQPSETVMGPAAIQGCTRSPRETGKRPWPSAFSSEGSSCLSL